MEDANNILEQIGDILAEKQSGGGSVHSDGGSSSDYSNYTNRHENVNESSDSRTVKGTLGDRAYLLPEPPQYQMQPFDYSPFRDMIRQADERKQKALATNLSEQERERRKGRYQAWTNFGQALGNLAGAGYAPVAKQDNSRALDSYAKLDALRKQYDAIDSADNLSWIQKLMIQSKLQHDEKELERYKAAEQDRLKVAHWNQQARNAFGETTTTKDSEKVRQVEQLLEGWSDTQNWNDKSTSMWRSIYKNPKWTAFETSLRAGANANAPFTNIGENVDYSINGSEAGDIIAQVRNIDESIVRGTPRIENGYYVSDNGLRIRKDLFDQQRDRIMNKIASRVGKLGDNYDNNKLEFSNLIHELDVDTGYAFVPYVQSYKSRRSGQAPTPTQNPTLDPKRRPSAQNTGAVTDTGKIKKPWDTK